MLLNVRGCLSNYSIKYDNKAAVSNGTLVTTLPSESQTSGYDRLNHGRQFDSISTSSSLPEAWRSTRICCVFLQDSYLWGVPLFLYLLSPEREKGKKSRNNNFKLLRLKRFSITVLLRQNTHQHGIST